MIVASGGYRVVYRLVGGVYLMLVAAPHSNVLWLLELVSACVRILIAVSRGVEVTPDKLARRYPEVPACPSLNTVRLSLNYLRDKSTRGALHA